MIESHHTDIVVVGAGPVGLFTVFEAGMLRMKCHVVDTLEQAGGQCAALYPEKPIYDIAGYPKIGAQELIDRLTEQAAPFAPYYHFGRRVERLEKISEGGFRVHISSGSIIECKAVAIAAGCGAFGPHRPPLENIEAFEAAGSVRYFVARREDYRGKRVVIAGGGDSAVDWALSLAEIAARVSVVHRRPKFRAAPESERKLNEMAAAGRIDLVVPYQLAALEGEGGKLSAVRVASLEGDEKTVAADALLPFFGLAMELGPIAEWGLNLDKNHIAVDPATCVTSAPGIFAVGDIATYPGKLKLILCGFAEAAMAAHAMHVLVHPGEALHFEYSTSKGVPA